MALIANNYIYIHQPFHAVMCHFFHWLLSVQVALVGKLITLKDEWADKGYTYNSALH